MSEKKQLNGEQLEKVNGGENAAPKGWEDDKCNPSGDNSNQQDQNVFRCPEC